MGLELNTVRGVVRHVDQDFVEVEVEQGGCGRCHEEGGCGGQNLTQMFCAGQKRYRLANTFSVVVGERVEIAIADGSVRKTANLIYGVPLLSAICASVTGSLLAGDVGAVIGCILGLAAAFAYVRVKTRHPDGKLAEQPYIVSKL